MCLSVTKGAFLAACPNQVCHECCICCGANMSRHYRSHQAAATSVSERLIVPVCHITLTRRQLQKDCAIGLFPIYCSPPGLIISQDVIGHRWNSYLSICAPVSFLCCHPLPPSFSVFFCPHAGRLCPVCQN